MPTYTIHVRIPFRTPAGRELDLHDQKIVLENPPVPLASLALTVRRHGRRVHVPIRVPTIDSTGAPLPDGTHFDITWPEGVELAPDTTEIATVARSDGTPIGVIKEIYRA